ncbi:MAG: zinc ribbon domain-containing protein [Lachnospiraceae bacterium]|nr:zinc ribbon domain-containing protein [Lachnospiraceae bacterium]
MFCKQCGEKLLEGDVFCPECGWKIEAVSPTSMLNSEPVSPTPSPMMGSVSEAPTDKKKGKFPKWASGLIAVVVVAAAAAAVVIFGLPMLKGNSVSSESTIKTSYAAEDDTVVISVGDGSSITIGDAKQATLTADGKHMVILYTDDALYMMDREQKNPVCLEEKCLNYDCVRDEGFFYQDKEGNIYRAKFEDASVVKLKDAENVSVAAHTTTAIFKNSRDQLVKLNADSEEMEKIGTCKKMQQMDITDQGDMALWVDESDGVTVYAYEDDTKTKVAELSDDEDVDLLLSKDQGTCLVVAKEKLWIKRVGAEAVPVNMPSSGSIDDVYTAQGEIESVDVAKNDYFYVVADGSSNSNLYAVGMDGERERVLANVYVSNIANGRIVWMDEEENLYHGKLNGTTISDETRIASEGMSIRCSKDMKTVLFFKNVSDDEGTLCCWRENKSDIEKIAKDINIYTRITIGESDNAVYYLAETESISNGSIFDVYGTLMRWKSGADKAERLTSDIMSTNFGRQMGKTLTFLRYQGSDKKNDDICYADLVAVDGKNVSTISTDLKINM